MGSALAQSPSTRWWNRVAPFFDFRKFFPTFSDEAFNRHRHWLAPTYLDPATGRIVLRIQSYLLQTPHHNILIDSCVGNHKPRPARAFWDMLDSDRIKETSRQPVCSWRT